jgi:hypothetical protein
LSGISLADLMARKDVQDISERQDLLHMDGVLASTRITDNEKAVV